MWHTDPVNYWNDKTEPLPPSMLACKSIYAVGYQAAQEHARAMASEKPQIFVVDSTSGETTLVESFAANAP